MIEKTVLLVGNRNPFEASLSRYLKTKNYNVIEWDETQNKRHPIIIFLYKNHKATNQLSKILTSIKENPHTLPIILINMNSDSPSINLANLKNENESIIEIPIHAKVKDLFIKQTDKSKEHLDSFVQPLWEVIEQYLVNNNTKENRHFNDKIGVVGLGYVGLPVALGFANRYEVIGYDINKEKINNLRKNNDLQGQFSTSDIKEAAINFVSDSATLKNCKYIIVAVPTPMTSSKQPDLTYLKNASTTIGKHLSQQTTIIFESTVYPGTTEEVCVPILEEMSGLTAGIDFHVGYSPERINPGDEKRTFNKNPKIVSGQDAIALNKIYRFYHSVIDAQIYKAPSIKVAEAAKIVENTQRDINISLMNELSLIFDKLGIDTFEVLEAAKTKWNFLPFTPGLVGGHCIGVDPYFLIHQARENGYEPNFLSAAREVNESMSDYVVQSLLKLIMLQQIDIQKLHVAVLGITFKENIPDLRNSKALDIIDKLKQVGISVQACDPYASPHELNKDIPLVKNVSQLKKADVIILAVPHQEFIRENMTFLKDLLKTNTGVIMDLKGIVSKQDLPEDITLWRL